MGSTLEMFFSLKIRIFCIALRDDLGDLLDLQLILDDMALWAEEPVKPG